jgi:general secretion pathway protein K
VNGSKVSEPDLDAFARLFELLQLPSGQVDAMAENLRLALAPGGGDRPLIPQQIDQLVWLGVPPQTVAALRPYVTILPVRTTVNLNTASAEVIYASLPGIGMADAQHLVSARQGSPFRTVLEATKLLNGDPAATPPGQANVGVASRFFEVQARLRLDQLIVEERSVVQRDGVNTRVLLRERAPAGPPRAEQASANR